MTKLQKLKKAIQYIIKEPSLLTLILDQNDIRKQEFQKIYPQFPSLPEVSLDEISNGNFQENVDLFILDGGSLPTDLSLLKTLAKGKQSYFEIGTWRGESVWNVAKEIDDCTTLNLSKEEMKEMGWNREYADLHGILSSKNPKILHLEGNTKTYDFAGLSKKYDLIFIDGDHSYEMVKHDTEKVFQHLVHEETVVVWHDYAYNPEKIRYEVFRAILDALPEELHHNLYHPQNTMCAIFTRKKYKTTNFESPKKPEFLFEVNLKSNTF
jgi:predicted O-methyltransferase YrrM